MPTGKLITIEGLDGAGKSTLATALSATLLARGLPVELLREPGGTQLSESVRDIVKNPSLRIGARAEALLYAAARAQLVEEIVTRATEADTAEAWRDAHRSAERTADQVPREAHADS